MDTQPHTLPCDSHSHGLNSLAFGWVRLIMTPQQVAWVHLESWLPSRDSERSDTCLTVKGTEARRAVPCPCFTLGNTRAGASAWLHVRATGGADLPTSSPRRPRPWFLRPVSLACKGPRTRVPRVSQDPYGRAELTNHLPRLAAGAPGRPTKTDNRGPRDLRVCGATVILRTLEGQAAETALDVEAGLVDGAVVYAGHTLVNVCERPQGDTVKAQATRAVPTLRPGCSGLPPARVRLGFGPSLPSVGCSLEQRCVPGLLFIGHLYLQSSHLLFTIPGMSVAITANSLMALEMLPRGLRVLLTIHGGEVLLASFRGKLA